MGNIVTLYLEGDGRRIEGSRVVGAWETREKERELEEFAITEQMTVRY